MKMIFTQEQKIVNLPQDHALARLGYILKNMFISGLEEIISTGPSTIKALCNEVKNIINEKNVEFCISDVSSLTMVVLGDEKNLQIHNSTIILPINWGIMAMTNPGFELGAIIFISSQLVDVQNGLLEYGSEQITKRAQSLEAEFVKTLNVESLNEYQKNLLDKYPDGVKRSLEVN